MSLSTNQNALIEELEKSNSINSRYENLTCVNALGGHRRGVLSLVFQGYDLLENNLVAIKVMDPDRLGDSYRISAFEREPALLEILEGKNRCLQIKDGLQYYNWELQYPGIHDPLRFRCGFFVMEWLEEDADEFFFEQQNHDPIEKLNVFRQLLLAVEAIHRAQIFHRDIKVDNIRIKQIGNQSTILLIDFGTAAHRDDASIATAYPKPVGAPAFSPPEAFVGFSGDRLLGRLSDSYALGAMLFNLFNYREFRHARVTETEFENVVAAIRSTMATRISRDERVEVWRDHVHRFRSLTQPPSIKGVGTTLPVSICQLIESIYVRLVAFDFASRTSNLEKVRGRIDSAIRLLENQNREAIELKRRRIIRSRRQEKVRRKQKRVEMYSAQGRLSNAQS